MYSTDVMNLNAMNGTSFSGVSPIHYDNQWGKNDTDDFKLKSEYKEHYVVDGTTSTSTKSDDFSFILVGDGTTANFILKISTKDFIRQWQHVQFPEIYQKISGQLFTIRQRQDNWDGCGSKKPNKQSISHAEGIILDLLKTVIENGYLWLTPFISSDEDGFISIEWHKGQYELHIEVREDEAEYIKVWGTNIDSEMHLDFLEKNSYRTIWNWLLHG